MFPLEDAAQQGHGLANSDIARVSAVKGRRFWVKIKQHIHEWESRPSVSPRVMWRRAGYAHKNDLSQGEVMMKHPYGWHQAVCLDHVI